MNKNNIILSKDLIGKIPDIDNTDECWITETSTANDFYFISYISGDDSDGINSFDIDYSYSRLTKGESFSVLLSIDEDKENNEISLFEAQFSGLLDKGLISYEVEEDFVLTDYNTITITAINDVDITFPLYYFMIIAGNILED